MGTRRGLTRARRLVVKVGSGLITSPGEGLDAKRINALAADIAALVAERREVALVSSGAIVAGTARRRTGQTVTEQWDARGKTARDRAIAAR